MYHVEVRQFPNVTRSFNLSEAELAAKVLGPWVRKQVFTLGEREWEPTRAKLTVLEGRELRSDEMGLGRGWANITRVAEDVTDRVLALARVQAKPGGVAEASGSSSVFKDVILAQCATDRLAIHQVMWLAHSRHPEWRVSERLALVESAVWELLHEGRLTMLKRDPGEDGPEYAPAERSQWQPVLLSWATWSDSAEPRWFVEEATPGVDGS
ncbi:MAG TPA: hypothetical protein VG294_10100 [Solirubrobacteraceae bacterium]|jgi:hypothetical protein|nr:hypothetical protein [Solirubrobacteraceae bacterium]